MFLWLHYVEGFFFLFIKFLEGISGVKGKALTKFADMGNSGRQKGLEISQESE